MADSTITAIQKKVRRLTRSPSEQQLSTADINEYINTFVLYDFPAELSLDSFRTTLTWYTDPGVDLYATDATSGIGELSNFRNIYTSVYMPIFIGGFESQLSMSEAEFYREYPLTNSVVSEGTGDGVVTAFTGTLSSKPLAKNNVIFTSIDINGIGLKVIDDGAAGPDGVLSGDGVGAINYETGVWNVTWGTAPGSGEIVYSNTIPYAASRPNTILYFDNNFRVRPIPDKVYPIQMEVTKRPTEFGTSPELEQWWQYIAIGAASTILFDRGDFEGVQALKPELDRQETFVLRRTTRNLSQQRTPTIFNSSRSRYRYW